MQNLDEIGIFGKVASMKSALFDVSQGAKERDESEKFTRRIGDDDKKSRVKASKDRGKSVKKAGVKGSKVRGKDQKSRGKKRQE